jgi:hypothetical protein
MHYSLEYMKPEDLFKLHERLTTEALAIMKQKSKDYANKEDALVNFKRPEIMGFGTAENGLCCRILDKMSRISSFLTRGELSVKNESVYDAIQDNINYFVLLYALIQEKESNKTQ